MNSNTMEWYLITIIVLVLINIYVCGAEKFKVVVYKRQAKRVNNAHFNRNRSHIPVNMRTPYGL